MITNGNEPVNSIVDKNFDVVIEGEKVAYYANCIGLTKREYFSAFAMQGLLAHNCEQFKDDDLEAKGVCKRSVILADELINALNEKP